MDFGLYTFFTLDTNTGLWVSRPQFVGHDKATRLVHKMEQVFIKATENTL